jgi:hypothetical protein
MVRAYTEWSGLDAHVPEPARPSDLDEIEAMVAEHEGGAAGSLARRYLEAHPESGIIIRDGSEHASGYFSLLRLDRVAAELAAEDPVTRAALQYVERRGGMTGPVIFNRHWLAAETYQSLSTVQMVCTGLMTQAHLQHPDLHHALGVFREAAPYRLMFATLSFDAVASATLGGASYTIVARDWRGAPPLPWVVGFVTALTGVAPAAQPDESASAARAREAFEGHVRDALKTAAFAPRLAETQLAAAMTSGSPHERAREVSRLLREGTAALGASPRGQKLARALEATYLDPLGPQEQVADALGLPLSTYRRHLAAGIEHLADHLWAELEARRAARS